MQAVHTLSLLVLLTPVLHGADGKLDRRSWNNLELLRAGQTVQVKTGDAKWNGTFLALTSDSVLIRTKNGERAIQRNEVRSVKRRSAATRIRHTLIGAGIGAAAGAAIAFPNINEGYAAHTAVAAAVLTLVGSTVVGAILPNYSTVYESGP